MNKNSHLNSFSAVVVLMLLAVFMGGCLTTQKTITYAPDGITKQSETEQPGSIFGPSDYDRYADMIIKANEYKVTLMTACNSVMSKTPTDVESATSRMAEQSCKQQVANMRLDITAPETWPGVVKAGLQQTPLSLAITKGAEVAKAGLDAAGNTSFGDNATVKDSFVKNENHSTGSNTVATLQPKEVRPEVVEQAPPIIVVDGAVAQ